ncbi:MAG: sugar phosphate isomerase/epimerase [Planctomycetota bacterium]|nr:MAG: sugar phosphate isomerase/epimerase [Planctomycetota bacterium]
MLRLLSTRSYAERIADASSGVTLLDLPRFARERFAFRGLCVSTEQLAGADEQTLLALREAGDKASCPTLALQEPAPLALAGLDVARAEEAQRRLLRVVRAAHLLGCSSLIVRLAPPEEEAGADATLDRLAARLRSCVEAAERLELNLLLAPTSGIFASSEGLSETIKKVGGFRMGSAPDFEAAAQAEDPADAVRQLTPYASCVIVSSLEFTPRGRHKAYDIVAMVRSLLELGYDGPIVIEHRGGGDPDKAVTHALACVDAALEEAQA